MMKAIATITGILLLISTFSLFVNIVWSLIEGASFGRWTINSFLEILARFMLGLFLMLFSEKN